VPRRGGQSCTWSGRWGVKSRFVVSNKRLSFECDRNGFRNEGRLIGETDNCCVDDEGNVSEFYWGGNVAFSTYW
jgi:hypothetical protein